MSLSSFFLDSHSSGPQSKDFRNHETEAHHWIFKFLQNHRKKKFHSIRCRWSNIIVQFSIRTTRVPAPQESVEAWDDFTPPSTEKKLKEKSVAKRWNRKAVKLSIPPQVLSWENILRQAKRLKCKHSTNASVAYTKTPLRTAKFIQTFNQAIRLSKSPLKMPSIGINKSKSAF